CSIVVCCNKCARIHDTGISLLMKDCPVRKQSLADLYKGKVPKRVKKLSRTIVTCPWTEAVSPDRQRQNFFSSNQFTLTVGYRVAGNDANANTLTVAPYWHRKQNKNACSNKH